MWCGFSGPFFVSFLDGGFGVVRFVFVRVFFLKWWVLLVCLWFECFVASLECKVGFLVIMGMESIMSV